MPEKSELEWVIAENPQMRKRRVLVTGAGTGIGRGIALEFAREGADVALHYYNEEEGVSSAVQTIREAGGRVEKFQADFKNQDDVRTVFNDAYSFLSGIDVLVNNSGITMNRPFEKVTPQQYDTLFNVNVKAAYFLTQAVAPGMIAQEKGHIINMASLHAYHAMREHSVYAMTKAAIVALTRSTAIELAPHGIHVNAIMPGWCLVENHFKAERNLDVKKSAEKIPAGRHSTPADIGKLAVFLATPAADHFLGTILQYDSGQGALFPNGPDFRTPLTCEYGKEYVEGLD